MVEAVKLNYPQREIADAAFALQQEIDAGERIVVGVNSFVAEHEQPIPTLRVDPDLERKQVGRLHAARAHRDGAAVERTLASLREHAAHSERNLMEPLLDVRPRTRQRGRDRGVPAAGVRRLRRDPRLLRRPSTTRPTNARPGGARPAAGRSQLRPCRGVTQM